VSAGHYQHIPFIRLKSRQQDDHTTVDIGLRCSNWLIQKLTLEPLDDPMLEFQPLDLASVGFVLVLWIEDYTEVSLVHC
jgi:hypothetical protein